MWQTTLWCRQLSLLYKISSRIRWGDIGGPWGWMKFVYCWLESQPLILTVYIWYKILTLLCKANNVCQLMTSVLFINFFVKLTTPTTCHYINFSCEIIPQLKLLCCFNWVSKLYMKRICIVLLSSVYSTVWMFWKTPLFIVQYLLENVLFYTVVVKKINLHPSFKLNFKLRKWKEKKLCQQAMLLIKLHL